MKASTCTDHLMISSLPVLTSPRERQGDTLKAKDALPPRMLSCGTNDCLRQLATASQSQKAATALKRHPAEAESVFPKSVHGVAPCEKITQRLPKALCVRSLACAGLFRMLCFPEARAEAGRFKKADCNTLEGRLQMLCTPNAKADAGRFK